MNKLVSITLGAAAAYGIVRYLQMQNVSNQTSFRLDNPRVHDVNLGGLYFRTEVEINNPLLNSVRMTKPVINLTSNGVLLAQSNAENKTIVIKPLGMTQIDTIELRIGWISLVGIVANIVSKIPAIIKAFKSGGQKEMALKLGIPLEMSFSSYVNGLFYQSGPTKII
jgi:hypothetical protein